mmetsp:Transcript_108001/g.314188  ORF Transcript_108001/g.314188 Transcript_108001/m.314188 type:complete len:98 (+) Transcript_108001:379-672(+)
MEMGKSDEVISFGIVSARISQKNLLGCERNHLATGVQADFNTRIDGAARLGLPQPDDLTGGPDIVKIGYPDERVDLHRGGWRQLTPTVEKMKPGLVK